MNNNDVLIVHFGELTLKKKNYFYFFSTLLSNIREKLKKYKNSIKILKEHQRLYIEILENKILYEVIDNIKMIFGISSISIAKKCQNNFEEIKKNAVQILKDEKNKTFKIESRRTNKSFPLTSIEIAKTLGGWILKKLPNNNFVVNVNNPEIILRIEVRSSFSLIYFNSFKAFGGLPYGTSGKGLSLISGGIDSPVSSFLAMKKGLRLDFIHFNTPPFTTDLALKKVIDLVKVLKNYANNSKINLYVVNFTMLQNEISHIKEESYRIAIMRRMFFRIADLLAEKINAKALVTGESLGQVASQTIESLIVSNDASEKLILRPLIAYDKKDIINISEKINTYKISILDHDDSCSLFVPKNPITKPKVDIAKKQEINLLYNEIINSIMENKIKKYII